MDELDLLLKQQTEMQRQAELKRNAMLEDQLIRELEASGRDSRVNLSSLASIVQGNTPLVQAMQQSGAQADKDKSEKDRALQELELMLTKNVGTGDLDTNQLLNVQMHKDRMNADRQKLALTSGAGKGKQLSAKDILTINEGNSIPTMLSDVKQTLNQAKDIMGPFVGRLGQVNPYDTKAQAVDSEIRASSQAFGRYMEDGVLRKEDEAKYRKMFPNLTDTPEVAAEKLTVVERLLTQKQKSNVEALRASGYDISAVDKIKEVTPRSTLLSKGSATELIPTANASSVSVKNLADYSEAELNALSDSEMDALLKRSKK